MARIIVFIIFGGFGLVMLYVGVTQFFVQRRLMQNAVRIEVLITHSQVRSSTSSDTDRRINRNTSTTTHRPDIRFTYEVAGKTYESDLIHPNIIVYGHASHDSAAEELRPFPVGARVPAYVDPAHPDKAFLIAQAGAGPIVFMILGVILPPLAWWVGKFI